ncbi:MAG: hypothetical protein R3C28_26810 [Pirellulaceae bacterium]
MTPFYSTEPELVLNEQIGPAAARTATIAIEFGVVSLAASADVACKQVDILGVSRWET